MSEELNMKKARQVYESFHGMLDSKRWRYDKNDEEMTITTGVKGDDLPIDLFVSIRPRQEIVHLRSVFPFHVPQGKRVDCAIAVAVANYGLCDGSFDYDVNDGEISFRLTSSYRESTLGNDLFEYMLMVSAGTVDDYNDRLLKLSKGEITLQQFIEMEPR